MALRKLVFVNENGQYVELDQTNDSIKLKEIELGASILTEAKLSKLIDGVDAADEHIHDARYFRQDQHITTRDNVNGLNKPVNTDPVDGYIDNSFIDPTVAGQLSHSDLLDLSADDHLQYLNRDGSRPMTGAIDMDGNSILNVASPISGTDAVNKDYVDSVATGLRPKGNVAAASTADIPALSGLLVIDGYQTVAGDRILVKDQTDLTQNGIYVVSAGAWTRSEDQDNSPLAEIVNGVFIPRVLNGTQTDKGFFIKSVGTGADGMHIVGTDDIEFDIFTSPTQLSEGNGINFNGNVVEAALKAAGGLKFDAGEIAVEPGDFAGEGLLDDGSDNLAIDWSSTYDDNKAIKAADLSSNATGKGASIIGVEDADGYFTGDNVEAVLKEMWEALDESGGVKYIASGAISKGHLVVSVGNNTVSTYSDLTSDAPVLGAAFNAAADTELVKAVNADFVITGVLSGATAGTRYFWTGTALATSLPSGADANCYQVGIAKNATDLTVGVKFIKKNGPA